MKPKAKKRTGKKKMGIAIKLLICFFVIYSGVTVTSQQVKIQKKISENTGLKEQIVAQKMKNEELREMIENTNNDEYYAQIAREDLGYVSKGERLFVDISSM